MSAFGDKDKLLGSLLAPKQIKKGPSIREIDSNGNNVEKEVVEELELNEDGEFVIPDKESTDLGATGADKSSKAVISQEPEAPSLFDEMMAAQAAAKKEKEAKTQKAANKSFGGGFKKGFFSSSSNNNSSNSTMKKKSGKSNVIDVKAPNNGGKNKQTDKSDTLSSIAKEVGAAMEESTNPAVKELQKGEWMTPDLVKIFAHNPIISKGLTNPKCQQAMQLMQKDPEEARKRFGGDKEVDIFMREFGKVMSAHFEQLGEEQERAKIREQAGPLAAEAMRREEERRQKQPKAAESPGIQPYDKKKAEEKAKEDAKVKDIVNDPELAALLMDQNMQRILQECGDPAKFQQHMRNPDTARKINLLFKSGLVKTE
jgi:hypothetical protein